MLTRSSFVFLCNKAVRSCFFDEVFGYDIPLLAKEGWREAPGWSLTPKRFEMRFETWLVSDHPVSAASEASRHFLSGRATLLRKEGNAHHLKTRLPLHFGRIRTSPSGARAGTGSRRGYWTFP